VPAAAGAEKVTCWVVPGIRVNEDADEELIPSGNPLTVTVTAPVNPFTALSETVTGDVVAPTWVETEEGETAILKSPVGGGGGGEEVPQPLRRNKLLREIRNSRNIFVIPP
jgi:hypothetical protein